MVGEGGDEGGDEGMAGDGGQDGALVADMVDLLQLDDFCLAEDLEGVELGVLLVVVLGVVWTDETDAGKGS